MKVPIGVKRLDDLLKGGVPPQSFTLLYGPQFLGKETLSQRFLMTGLAAGKPAIFLRTNGTVESLRAQLEAIDPDLPRYESRGLVAYIDAYTRAIGGPEDAPHTEYVDGPLNLNGLAVAMTNAHRKIAADQAAHRLVLDSVSTLAAFTNAQTVFRFLQVLIGRSRAAGAVGFLLLDAGMHTDAEIQAFKHLCDGVIELRADGAKLVLSVTGAGISEPTGWTEYRFTPTEFDITGSFAAGRIR